MEEHKMKNIIAAIDFSSNSDGVLDLAAELAKSLGAKLWIIHATSIESSIPQVALETYEYYGIIQQFAEFPTDIEHDRELTAEKFRHEHKLLNALSAKFKSDGLEVTSLLLEGEPVELILKKAKEFAAELIVLGSYGHGEIHKLLIGSTCQDVLRDAECGVLVVPLKKEAQ
jgi:nucleotide-binding universal stress UspA family protein